ncbi:DNA polymerase III subunit gamma/tau [Agromyces atrinae]|uniref:DNA polymerase III subunit gamma/tau n=1 Tax=Agromyces atrinae TaxID=592376 RepID=A0A4Q2M2U2_9MICO|nr:DNA polymerase III subunit gamma/tau [Agromyces atrinae]NYD65679.1 hypothetical protein [Agromyces atrinae]RXZ85477.1 DNA polymerase III subunit gamma/tau [Agromyces atrinae]
MTRDRDDDALSWEGDDDPTLAPGWKTVGTSVPAPPTAAEAAGTGTETDDAREPHSDEAVDASQPSSATLILFGVFGGVYLLYTIGWIFSALRVPNPGVDAVAQFMFTLGLWFAVLAPAAWFATTLLATESGARRRIVWLVIGAVVLVPVPFVAGITS